MGGVAEVSVFEIFAPVWTGLKAACTPKANWRKAEIKRERECFNQWYSYWSVHTKSKKICVQFSKFSKSLGIRWSLSEKNDISIVWGTAYGISAMDDERFISEICIPNINEKMLLMITNNGNGSNKILVVSLNYIYH